MPRGVDWKTGVCRALGWPADGQADIARAWQRIRGRVRDWKDLEPALIGRVEELIDFVTAASDGDAASPKPASDVCAAADEAYARNRTNATFRTMQFLHV